MKRLADHGYNERLFAGGIRAKIHLSRFHWLAHGLKRLNCEPQRVLELGCFDAKTIDFLPAKPLTYVGLDANWEGGLEIARTKWKHEPNFSFLYCVRPADIELSEPFDVTICMETLEHVPPDTVDPYLAKLAALTGKYVFITVPNEKGVVFALKYLLKKMAGGDSLRCTLPEFVNQTLGRTDKVQRHEHKGFDYNVVVAAVAKYFDIVEVSSYPFRLLPKGFSFGVGIIGKKRSEDPGTGTMRNQRKQL
jgi:hypothetical protein